MRATDTIVTHLTKLVIHLLLTGMQVSSLLLDFILARSRSRIDVIIAVYGCRSACLGKLATLTGLSRDLEVVLLGLKRFGVACVRGWLMILNVIRVTVRWEALVLLTIVVRGILLCVLLALVARLL